VGCNADLSTAPEAPLSQTDHDFLHASSHAHRRTLRWRRAVTAGLLTLTLTAGIAVHDAATAAHNAATAERQHAIALSRQLAADSLNIDPTDPMTARQLAVAAWAIFPTSQAASAITTLLAEQPRTLPAGASLPGGSGPNDRVSWATFGPDGKLLISADADGIVQVWNPATSQPIGAPIHAGAPNGAIVAWGPDGKPLTSAGADRTVPVFPVPPPSAHPYAALCAVVGPLTRQEWNRYALGEPQPKVCR
jgi:hypothetical protein